MYIKQALCIGVNRYSPSYLALKPCLNDAQDMTMALRSIGFQAQYAGDVDYQSMLMQTVKFINSIKPGAVVIYYFSGHGVQHNGNNYLIPRDATGLYDGNVESRALEAEMLIEAMLKRGPRLVLFIIDACRTAPPTEPLDGYSRDRALAGLQPGFAPMTAPPATIVVYASAANETASARSPNNRNSLYTCFLLRHITTPNVDIDYLLKCVAIEVQNESKNKQVPFRYSSCNEPIYLAGYSGYKPLMPAQHTTVVPSAHSAHEHHRKQFATQPLFYNFYHQTNNQHIMPLNYHLIARNPSPNMINLPFGYYTQFSKQSRRNRR